VHGPRAVADPLTLCLPAGSPYSPALKLDWIEARRWPDGETVLVPREWVAAYDDQLPEPPALITPITNGLGAGLDRAHALAHGLLELIQRDGNVLTYRALDQGVVVELDDGVPPDVADLLARYRAAGIEPMVKLASTEFGIANLYVVGNDLGNPAVPIQVTSCGEAPHPDRGVALRKAALEFAGSRARKAATHGPLEALRRVLPPDYFDMQMRAARSHVDEKRATTAMAEWLGEDAATLRRWLADSVFADRRRVRFSDLPTVDPATVATSQARLAVLAERLHAAGAEILWLDCSPPGGEVHVAKVIVPGLESETMSYGRIGWRGVARLRARRDPLIRDAAAPGAARVRLRPEDEARCGGPAWFDRALAERIVGNLYPLYREPGPFAAQLMRESAHV
jgi:ribosomal protein S12 methylthiotransferase accessory factor